MRKPKASVQPVVQKWALDLKAEAKRLEDEARALERAADMLLHKEKEPLTAVAFRRDRDGDAIIHP